MAKSIFTSEHRDFIASLRDVRVAASITQAELSRRLGKNQSYISNIERGQRRLDVIEFSRIALALGQSPHVLFSQILATTKIAQ